MDNTVLISVVVPIYNIENYVEKCIKSIQKQSYGNLQIILVDDGSTDNSGIICDCCADADDRIEVIHKANGGLSDARNHGIDAAKGEYIAFVDGDDWIHPQMYEIMYNSIVETGSDIVTCGFAQTDEEGFLRNIDIDFVKPQIISGTEAICNVGIPFVSACNKLYRREVFANLRYPVGRLHEDEFVIHKIFYGCKKIAVLEEKLYFYAARNGSIISEISVKRIEDAISAFTDRINFVVEHNWIEALPAALSEYCKYCIYMYFDIKNGKYNLDRDIMDKLWEREKRMCELYHDVGIDSRYRDFARNPDIYERWLKSRERTANIKMLIKRCLSAIGIYRGSVNGTQSGI